MTKLKNHTCKQPKEMKVRLETNQAKTTNLEDNFKQINKIDNSLARPTKKREREDSNFHDQE